MHDFSSCTKAELIEKCREKGLPANKGNSRNILINRLNNPEQYLSKQRKSCEYPWSEFIVSMILAYLPNKITDIDEFLNSKNIPKDRIAFNTDNEYDRYIEDLRKNPSNKINQYIQQFYQQYSSYCSLENISIQRVFVSGKKNHHKEIIELNKGIDKKQQKSDIYLLLNDDTWIGFSVKNDYKATKSNYSLFKMLPNGDGKLLNDFLKQYLSDSGYPKFNKEQRTLVNALFHNRNNPFWIKVREFVLKHLSSISTTLSDCLNCKHVSNYPVYEFDGTTLCFMNKVETSQCEFSEYDEYYKTTTGVDRECAKMFYKLTVGNKKYRVELRWKGNCYVSPQFHIHNTLE